MSFASNMSCTPKTNPYTPMKIYLNPEASADYGLPYLKPKDGMTVIHSDSLRRMNHPDAHTLPGGDLRLAGTTEPGWWVIVSPSNGAGI